MVYNYLMENTYPKPTTIYQVIVTDGVTPTVLATTSNRFDADRALIFFAPRYDSDFYDIEVVAVQMDIPLEFTYEQLMTPMSNHA